MYCSTSLSSWTRISWNNSKSCCYRWSKFLELIHYVDASRVSSHCLIWNPTLVEPQHLIRYGIRNKKEGGLEVGGSVNKGICEIISRRLG